MNNLTTRKAFRNFSNPHKTIRLGEVGKFTRINKETRKRILLYPYHSREYREYEVKTFKGKDLGEDAKNQASFLSTTPETH